MSDFLTRLVERTQGVAQVAQPIIPPMFSPASTTLSDYSQNSTRDSEPFNAPNRAIATIPDDLSSATLNQPFRKTSNTRFAPPKHIESDHSEQVEAVSQQAINDQIEYSIIKHSSNLTNPEDLTNSKRQKENFFGNKPLTNKTVSESDRNTNLLSEQSPDAKKDVSGRFIDAGQVNVPRNLPEAERDQNTGTQLKHLLNEKRDESGVLIKSERVRGLQEIVESERDQNISPQPEHSLNKKRVTSEGLIDSDQASTLRGITEVKSNQSISPPEHSLNEKQEAYREPIYFDKASALQDITESTGTESTETSYLKPSSLGRIRFQQAAESEPSSAEPTIKVTIGRVEVRAIMPSAPIAPASRSRTRSPTLSLNDYLKQRNEGQR